MTKRRRRAVPTASRFEDMMNAATGGGSRPCATCRIVVAASTLDDQDACPACAGQPGRLRATATDRSLEIMARCVYVDASYENGVAGLAVVGELGIFTRAVAATSSTAAEVEALAWAMAIAAARGERDLIFRTDCEHAARTYCNGKPSRGWEVELIPRRRNQLADCLASQARLCDGFVRATLV